MSDHNQMPPTKNEPEKMTSFYRQFYQRRNMMQEIILDFFYSISSMPRLLMEVFIRRSLGERYFSTEQCIVLILLLLLGPYLVFGRGYGQTLWQVVLANWAWYAYSVAFAVMSFIRWKEVRREPSVFELGKFSMSSGVWFEFWDNVKPFGKPLTPRQIAIYAEPLLFFIAGLLFYWMHQTVAFLLLFVSVIYSLSYTASYKRGDNFIMNKLDKIICNQTLHDVLVNRKGPAETKGFNPTMGGPSLFEMREQLYNSFVNDHEDEAASVS